MKTLLFDFENGYKSLGSESEVEQMFGFPVLHPSSWRSTKHILSKIWQQDREMVTRKLGDILVEEQAVKYVPRNGTRVDTLIFDTATESIKQFQRDLKGNGRMTLPMWGELKSDLEMFFGYINQLPCHVIVNVHAKTIRDDDLGQIKYYPNIEGSSKEDVAKFFDFVFYTKVKTDENGKRHFLWVTAKDERYEHAKDRTQLLSTEMPQDYPTVFRAAKKKGWSNVKVLVIGQPGSGKTFSLSGLKS